MTDHEKETVSFFVNNGFFKKSFHLFKSQVQSVTSWNIWMKKDSLHYFKILSCKYKTEYMYPDNKIVKFE